MSGSLRLSLQLGICRSDGRSKRFRDHNSKLTGKLCLLGSNLPLTSRKHYSWSSSFSKRLCFWTGTSSCTNHHFRCCCSLNPGPSLDPKFVKDVTFSLSRSFNAVQQGPLVIKLASAIGVVVFAIWGLGPLVHLSRNIFFQKKDGNWKKSGTYLVITSYIQPLLLWMGAIFICRTLDPMPLPTEAGHIVKQRLLAFVKSLSTVLAFGYCFSSVIQQLQKYLMETRDSSDARNMGFQFASKAVYTAVWVAAVSLFMELLGFSAQKWLTAGGLGTVLLTLAGREIFTNFLSSAMIHATRPFVPNEWIQTKIDGYEVSGTVERIGWWSPTIIRGEDREAVHIPNYKFTMNVVRNLTQKTHWRIKTHISISHLDVSKINNIVADMRKVLSKHPQVEHKKLHRRVFFENIEPENQALRILVSCFVKTSHIEEYLRVKEIILLDLLRVVRHHRARLATPIRTVQKIFTDAELDSVPFSETMYDEGSVSNRPLLLIEPSYKINGEDKPKSQTRAPRAAEDNEKAPAKTTPDSKIDSKPKGTSPEPTTKEVQTQETKSESKVLQMPNVEKKDDPAVTRKAASTPDLGGRRHDGKQSKASLEENMVLGVALEGSKRTLPIEEEVEPSEDRKEFATLRSGNGPVLDEKDNGDVKRSSNPGSQGNDE